MKELIVYYSTKSNNTHRFVQKLGYENERIPMDGEGELFVDRDYVLIVPTYAGGVKKENGEVSVKGAVPNPVIHFLNHEENRAHCKAVISSGNTNFGDSYAIAGPVLSNKLQVPLLYQFELLGTIEDVERVKKLVQETLNEGEKE
ncbi:class Ib ribonucleoside-diphosphate reductase assembly flavoprotein NrdI [Aerococcus christensenii]|uniref:class Ib ribonucleoside-diphosphate reductase assembly flavoprotein NrdI n=1 Tax=Aerococcus christensenii TaxID=87541 RepID=UPI0023A95EA2|nr:class Ib ribonucleoside-diphosphate reductase assembly flavoprotein NrdI [Aerococcus christensenii]WEB70819.1 class Ib ribonucleoside-diphosphate reductase assembly flavoprotein NrdI [Aerococcus christensenii]